MSVSMCRFCVFVRAWCAVLCACTCVRKRLGRRMLREIARHSLQTGCLTISGTVGAGEENAYVVEFYKRWSG